MHQQRLYMSLRSDCRVRSRPVETEKLTTVYSSFGRSRRKIPVSRRTRSQKSKSVNHFLETSPPSRYAVDDSAVTDNQKKLFNYFPSMEVQEIMQEILNSSNFAKNPTYDPPECVKWILSISDEIKNRVKDFLNEKSQNRYKIVVNAIAGSCNAADVTFASRSVWNSKKDTYVEAQLKLSEKYLIVVLYAVQCE